VAAAAAPTGPSTDVAVTATARAATVFRRRMDPDGTAWVRQLSVL
jgi:hypothetical protein